MKKKKLLLGPVITIIAMILVIIIVSAIASAFGAQGEVTKVANGTLETSVTTVRSIFSEEGFKYLFSSPVQTFKTFQPLILLIISLMAISIGKASGLFKAVFTKFRKVKPSIITFITLFVGIISSLGNMVMLF
ncbi:MAG: AbgT family transporter [Bacilli bacterium]